MNKFINDQMRQVSRFCKEQYVEYKRFMNAFDIPNFETKRMLRDTDITVAQTTFPTKQDFNYYIKLYPKIILCNDEEKKATFYHEFTHIKDDYTINNLLDENDKEKFKASTIIFSEIRACRIETMQLLSFNAYDEQREIDENDILYFEDEKEKCTIIEFLSKQRERAIHNFNFKLEELKNKNTGYPEMIRQLSYYLGYIDLFVDKYNQFKDLSPFSAIFGNEVEDLFSFFHTNKEIKIEALDATYNLLEKFRENTVNYILEYKHGMGISDDEIIAGLQN
jgi:hypothetical protein